LFEGFVVDAPELLQTDILFGKFLHERFLFSPAG
jgi:hypothetical protein